MKPESSKRMARLEKKQKKMAALLEISKLNEYDRAVKAQMTNKTISDVSTTDPEPSPKRIRTDSEIISQKNQTCINSSENTLEKEKSVEPELGPSNKPKLTGEDFVKLKKLLREQSNRLRALPNFRLRDAGLNARLNVDYNTRVPLFITDIQHLIMYTLVGHFASYTPSRWCQIEKWSRVPHVNVLIIDNLSLFTYYTEKNKFQFLTSTFEHQLEIVSTKMYNVDMIQELSLVPLTSTQMSKFLSKYPNLETAAKDCVEVFDSVKHLFPIRVTNSKNIDFTLPTSDKFPRTQLLLSGWQLVEENLPLPIKGLMETKFNGYVLTKDCYEEVTPCSPMFGIDCEMCMTTSKDLELTRVSIVKEDLSVLYEELVKPDNRITDYLTRYSGITARMMRTVTKRLPDVQREIREILPPDAILVGQSLSNDLHALKMMHPYIIDTSVIFNITGDRSRKTKLQTLSREFLHERIQESSGGHCSIEDSLASLKLAKLKLQNSLYFGDAVMSGTDNQVKKLPNLGTSDYATSMLRKVTEVDKTAFVIGVNDTVNRYNYYTNKKVQIQNTKKIKFVSEQCNEMVVKTMCESVKQYSLNIAHVALTDDQLKKNSAETAEIVDKWIKELYENTVNTGLCMVIFGGHQEAGNGCCFIQLKKNPNNSHL